MKWIIIGENRFGEIIYGRLDDDGLIRVTCVAEHTEFVLWLAEGNTPEPWPPNEVIV